MYKRPVFRTILNRLMESRRFIQVLAGPRQSGKTTLARQIISDVSFPCHYASADTPTLQDPLWIEQQWDIARTKISSRKKGLLVLDEIQKIPKWSEMIKQKWDQDSASSRPLHVILLGCSPLLVQKGLTESLAGRFEIIPITHWSYKEMGSAFHWRLDQYIFFGGYPGAAPLIHDHNRWSQYIIQSLIETTISRDILLMNRVDKPALLRQLFELGCHYSGQILSYNKMLGQLHDAGNTTTLAHYLNLLQGSGLLAGISKYSGKKVRQRASSPKLVVLNTGLMSALSNLNIREARDKRNHWGRLVETAVGAHLVNGARGRNIEIFYWASGNREIDFVLSRGRSLIAIEVKSGAKQNHQPGLGAFSKRYTVEKKLLVGSGGIPLEDFLLEAPESLFE